MIKGRQKISGISRAYCVRNLGLAEQRKRLRELCGDNHPEVGKATMQMFAKTKYYWFRMPKLAAATIVLLAANFCCVKASAQDRSQQAAVLAPRPVLHPLDQIQAALRKAVSPGDICPENYFKSSTFTTHVFYYNWDISQISATEAGFGYTETIKWSTGWGWKHEAATFNFQFTNLGRLTVEPAGSAFRVMLPGDRSVMCLANGRQSWLVWNQQEDANAFVQAADWLIWQSSPEGKATIARQTESRDAFAQQLESWKAGARPNMPDDVHVHDVLAKQAYTEKNLQRARVEYEAGLGVFPVWPEGQFNLALICGETGDYDCAVEHMQNYLELVPDAQDAQAAKDKLIIWRDKLGNSSQPAIK